jgi:hypothetical protein
MANTSGQKLRSGPPGDRARPRARLGPGEECRDRGNPARLWQRPRITGGTGRVGSGRRSRLLSRDGEPALRDGELALEIVRLCAGEAS